MVVKPKCVWEMVVYFEKLKKISWKIEKGAASQTHFGFINIGSNMHHFSATAIFFSFFMDLRPCTKNNENEVNSDQNLQLWLIRV